GAAWARRARVRRAALWSEETVRAALAAGRLGPTALSISAFLGVVALAGPRWGEENIVAETRGLSLALAIDISRSMLAEDVSPNRLGRALREARRLVQDLNGDHLGLVVFAGSSYILSPLSVDGSALGLYLDALDPGVASEGGTGLAGGLGPGGGRGGGAAGPGGGGARPRRRLQAGPRQRIAHRARPAARLGAGAARRAGARGAGGVTPHGRADRGGAVLRRPAAGPRPGLDSAAQPGGEGMGSRRRDARPRGIPGRACAPSPGRHRLVQRRHRRVGRGRPGDRAAGAEIGRAHV